MNKNFGNQGPHERADYTISIPTKITDGLFMADHHIAQVPHIIFRIYNSSKTTKSLTSSTVQENKYPTPEMSTKSPSSLSSGPKIIYKISLTKMSSVLLSTSSNSAGDSTGVYLFTHI